MSALAAKLPEAMRFHAAGEIGKAQTLYTELLNEHPTHAEILFLLGTSHFQQQNFEAAREHLQRALKAEAKNPKHYYRLAEVELAAGQPLAAMEILIALLGKLPDDQTSYSTILTLIGKFPFQRQIIPPLRMAVKQQPNSIFLHALLAKMFLEVHSNAEAVPHFERVLKLSPQQNGEFMQCYGRALHRSGRYEQSHRVVEEALKHFPQEKMLWLQRANNYGAEGNQPEQLDSYVRGLKHNPGDAQMENSVALLQLQNSDFQEGFELYRARFRVEGQLYFPFPIPEWKGESVAGKKIVMWMEQGVGDIIMFASLLPWLLAQKPEKVLLLVQSEKLMPIFARAFPELELMPLFANQPESMWKEYDMHLPMGEMMRYGLPHYTPSAHPPFLKPETEKVRQFREKYKEQTGGKVLVGIAWHTVNPSTGYLRNIPLEQFMPLFTLPNVQCVSQQYTHPDALESFDKKLLDKYVLVDDSFSAFEDADALLAQIGAMDRVVTIQNATAHMAGSIGVETMLLLSRAADWRWGMDAVTNRWYNSVRVIRQQDTYRWDHTMRHVAKELETL